MSESSNKSGGVRGLFRVLCIGGVVLSLAGCIGEVLAFATNPQFAVMVQGPPEEIRVHEICFIAVMIGILSAIVGGFAWLIAANWARIKTSLQPEGGRYDSQSRSQDKVRE